MHTGTARRSKCSGSRHGLLWLDCFPSRFYSQTVIIPMSHQCSNSLPNRYRHYRTQGPQELRPCTISRTEQRLELHAVRLDAPFRACYDRCGSQTEEDIRPNARGREAVKRRSTARTLRYRQPCPPYQAEALLGRAQRVSHPCKMQCRMEFHRAMVERKLQPGGRPRASAENGDEALPAGFDATNATQEVRVADDFAETRLRGARQQACLRSM